MTADGSTHGTMSANVQELLKEGKLKLLISATKETQNKVFEIEINANGQAVIDPKSDIGKLFFTNVSGHAQFTGRFAEIGEKLDDNNNFEEGDSYFSFIPKFLASINCADGRFTKEIVKNKRTNLYFLKK